MKIKAVKFDENGKYYFSDFENNMSFPKMTLSPFGYDLFCTYDGHLGESNEFCMEKSYKNPLASKFYPGYSIYGDVYIVQIDLKEMKFVDCRDCVLKEIDFFYEYLNN